MAACKPPAEMVKGGAKPPPLELSHCQYFHDGALRHSEAFSVTGKLSFIASKIPFNGDPSRNEFLIFERAGATGTCSAEITSRARGLRAPRRERSEITSYRSRSWRHGGGGWGVPGRKMALNLRWITVFSGEGGGGESITHCCPAGVWWTRLFRRPRSRAQRRRTADEG